MTKDQAKKLSPGIYKIYWKNGGDSLASVGVDEKGDRWLAPTNWTRPGTADHWMEVDRVETRLLS